MFKKLSSKADQSVNASTVIQDVEQLATNDKQENILNKEKSSFSLFKILSITLENPGLITLAIAILFFLTVIILAKC